MQARLHVRARAVQLARRSTAGTVRCIFLYFFNAVQSCCFFFLSCLQILERSTRTGWGDGGWVGQFRGVLWKALRWTHFWRKASAEP